MIKYHQDHFESYLQVKHFLVTIVLPLSPYSYLTAIHRTTPLAFLEYNAFLRYHIFKWLIMLLALFRYLSSSNFKTAPQNYVALLLSLPAAHIPPPSCLLPSSSVTWLGSFLVFWLKDSKLDSSATLHYQSLIRMPMPMLSRRVPLGF